MNKGIVFSLLVISAIISKPAQATNPNLIICNNCSSGASFALKASNAFDDLPPQNILLGTKQTFVVNVQTNTVHFYRITRSYDSPPGQPTVGDFFVTSAGLATPPTGDAQDVDDALIAIHVFLQALATPVPSSDLNGLGFTSALDLIGPNTGPAGLNRTALNNALSDHFRNISSSVIGNFNDTVTRIVDTVLSDSNFNGVQSVTVTFPDGSRVEVDVTNIAPDFNNPNIIVVTLEVDPSSVRTDDNASFPQSAGQLNGFDMTTSNTDLGSALRRLFGRLGVDTSGGFGGSGNTNGAGCTRLSCSVEGANLTCVIQVVAAAECG